MGHVFPCLAYLNSSTVPYVSHFIRADNKMLPGLHPEGSVDYSGRHGSGGMALDNIFLVDPHIQGNNICPAHS